VLLADGDAGGRGDGEKVVVGVLVVEGTRKT
jgi:hypothetical protein